MTVIRTWLFYLLVTIATILMGVLLSPFLLGSRRAALLPQRWWSKVFLWLSHHVLDLRVEISGAEHLPEGPCLIAPKHQSAWETVAFLTLLGDTVLALKKELLWFPVLGWYMARSAHVPLDRDAGMKAMRALMAAADRAVGYGCKIVVFVEGTRVPVGEAPPIKPGIVGLYRHLGLPVVPVAIDSGRYWPRTGWLKRPGTVQVRIHPPIGPGLSKPALMAAIHTAINQDPALPPADAAPAPAPPAPGP